MQDGFPVWMTSLDTDFPTSSSDRLTKHPTHSDLLANNQVYAVHWILRDQTHLLTTLLRSRPSVWTPADVPGEPAWHQWKLCCIRGTKMGPHSLGMTKILTIFIGPSIRKTNLLKVFLYYSENELSKFRLKENILTGSCDAVPFFVLTLFLKCKNTTIIIKTEVYST